MANENTKILNVRIRNKYDSYENWASSSLVLEEGEIAIAYTTVDVKVDNGTAKHPALLMKVGDGSKTFANLPWVSARASDVLAACKTEEGLTTFVTNVINNSGIATNSALTALTTKVNNAEDAIDSLKLLVGDTKVATQIANAITALNLANTYDAKGAAASAESAAKTYADGLNTTMSGRVTVIEGKAHTHSFVESELNLIKSGDVSKWNSAEKNAKDYADGLDAEMDKRVDALEDKLGNGEGNVGSQISAAVAAEAKLRDDADKALQEQITANDGDILALQGLVGETKVVEQINTAVAAEKERAQGVENGLNNRLATVEGDYLKSSDKTALENKIKSNTDAIALLTNGADPDIVDGVNDLITYVSEHGTEVTGIKEDINTNANDIDALEGRMTTVEGAVATKAEQSALNTLAGRVSTVEGDLNTATTGLKARMTQAEADIDALETKVGDKTVAAQIQAAIDALKIGDYAKASALTAAINQHNTDKAALEASIATKANDADLAAVAKSGLIDDLSIGTGTTLIFDCGGAV